MSDRTIEWEPLENFALENLVKGDLIQLNPNFEHYHFQRFAGQVGIVEKSVGYGMVWVWFMEEGRLGSFVLQREKILKIS